MFFGLIGKIRWRPWPLIGWDIFDFFSETAERNSTKLDKKQDLNVLYQVYLFLTYQKNKMATLASDWLRHFRLLLWNPWMDFNATWQEARSHHPLPSLSVSGRSINKKGRPGWFLSKVARNTQMHDMWPFWPLVLLQGYRRNLTGSKFQMSPVKFGSCGQISSLLFKFCIKEVEVVCDNSNKHALFLFQIYWLPPTLERFLMVPDAYAIMETLPQNTPYKCTIIEHKFKLCYVEICLFIIKVLNYWLHFSSS